MAKSRDNRAPFEIADTGIAPGTRETVSLGVSHLPNEMPVQMSVTVIHGESDGPTLFVSAGIHGDEINGIEILRRLLLRPELDALRGTLIAVPIVNAYGFMNNSRYLPDRRDLNRCFPGRRKGSMAARLAHTFFSEVVQRAEVGIDLHSAAIHRTNLPQIRISPDSARSADLAKAFDAPVTLVSKLRDKSLRQAASARGIEVLLFEAGEGLRFDEDSIAIGIEGILQVMRALGMLEGQSGKAPRGVAAGKSAWVRAGKSGLMTARAKIGDRVTEGERLATIATPNSSASLDVSAQQSGILIGAATLPVVYEGDALFHIATLTNDALEDRRGTAMPDEDEVNEMQHEKANDDQ